MIKDFQAELAPLSVAIAERNTELELPYNYLNPKNIENSISIWTGSIVYSTAVIVLLSCVMHLRQWFLYCKSKDSLTHLFFFYCVICSKETSGNTTVTKAIVLNLISYASWIALESQLVSQLIGPNLWSRLKHFSNHWMDRHEILPQLFL